MPSGYTAKIYDGTEESIKTFLTGAARGMGLYIMQRDESSDEPLKKREVGEYYYDSVERDKKRLQELMDMNSSGKTLAWIEAEHARKEELRKSIQKNAEMKARYDKFIADFEDIEWPADDEDSQQFFANFKKFAGDQLVDSYRWDVHDEEDIAKWHSNKFSSPDEWWAHEMEMAARSLGNSQKYLAEEIERCRTQNLIHDRFIEFLGEL